MTDYKFRFVTRTRYTDYRVYVQGGRETISNRDGFRPLRQKCSIIENEQCACVFIEEDKIYLVVSALDCHKNDYRGRAIKLSFCQIFTNEDDAASAFIKITNCWEDAEEWLNNNLHTINENSEAERAELDEAAFMNWLVSDRCEFDSNEWPADGEVLKWTRQDGKEKYIKVGEVHNILQPDAPDPAPKGVNKKKVIAVGVTVLTSIVIIGGLCYVLGSGDKVQEIKEAADNSKPGISKNVFVDEISKDIKNLLSSGDVKSSDAEASSSDDIKSRDVTALYRELRGDVIEALHETWALEDNKQTQIKIYA